VRKLKGLEHFLSATPYRELVGSDLSGVVVIINMSRFGCHALIIDPAAEGPQVVDLPALSMRVVSDHAETMRVALAGAADHDESLITRQAHQFAVFNILYWLWGAAAEPILAVLGYTGKPEPGKPAPRVWWCPTGPLALLPVHAAGSHPMWHGQESDDVDCVLDRVISS
jgi:hypothetical protein